MEIKFVNFKAPSKRFVKNKKSGDIYVVSKITFEVEGMDDETLRLITQASDSGMTVSVEIKWDMISI